MDENFFKEKEVKNLFFIFLCFITACSFSKKNEVSYSDWDILENFIKEDWNQKRFLEIKGPPHEKITLTKEKKIAFLYQDVRGFQKWSFVFTVEGRAETVSYFPIDEHSSLFSDEAIRKKWVDLHCEIKWQRKKLADIYKDTKILDCDQGHRVYYNGRGEVESISVDRNPKPIQSL